MGRDDPDDTKGKLQYQAQQLLALAHEYFSVEDEAIENAFKYCPDYSASWLANWLTRANDMRPVTILFISADSQDLSPIGFVEEYTALSRALGPSRQTGRMVVARAPNCSVSELHSAIVKHRPQILHFSGHGSNKGFYFVNSDGEGETLNPKALAQYLTLQGPKVGLRLAVFSACQADVHAELYADAVG